jgi:hypothetical protein
MKPIIGQTTPEVPQDHPMVLQYQLTYVQRMLNSASQRKERLEDLMKRRAAKQWDAAKKAQMVRRLVTVTQTVEQCVGAIDELTKQLEGVMAKMGATQANTVAPFIKAPPTSIEELAQQPIPEPAGLETLFET